jgi:hypothetical protein
MAKRIIRPTPDDLGYQDRGKMKWIGLMLSDHSESLNKMAAQANKKEIKPKPKQSLAEIGEILAEAYQTKRPVSIQANILSNGSYFDDIACTVSGTEGNRIFLKLKNGRLVDMTIEDIRHIEFLDPAVWHEKNSSNFH